jgi:hypothetical protein
MGNLPSYSDASMQYIAEDPSNCIHFVRFRPDFKTCFCGPITHAITHVHMQLSLLYLLIAIAASRDVLPQLRL